MDRNSAKISTLGMHTVWKLSNKSLASLQILYDLNFKSTEYILCGRTIEDTYFFCLVLTERLRLLKLHETFIYFLNLNYETLRKLLFNPVFCNITLHIYVRILNKILVANASCYWHSGCYSVSVVRYRMHVFWNVPFDYSNC